jgi:hypothetical protein
MNKLKIIFDKFKSVSFPEDSSESKELGDIFCDLVLFDSQIAGSIDKIISGKNTAFNEIKYDQELENRLISIINSNTGTVDTSAANKYLKYLLELKNLIKELDSFNLRAT